MRPAIIVVTAMLAGACQQHTPAPVVSTESVWKAQIAYDDIMRRRASILQRARSGALANSASILRASRLEAEIYVDARIARGDMDGSRDAMITRATSGIAQEALNSIGSASAAVSPAAEAEAEAMIDAAKQILGAAKPEQALIPAATAIVDRRTPPLKGPPRTAEIRRIAAELRNEVERRHAAMIATRARADEDELVRMSLSNLADMPREIRLVAERRVAASRSPFSPSVSGTVAASALHAEEARLRDVIEQRRGAFRRDQAAAALAAQELAVRAYCDRVAAAVGAATGSPSYGSRRSIFAQAVAGALASTIAEERERAQCLRLNGL